MTTANSLTKLTDTMLQHYSPRRRDRDDVGGRDAADDARRDWLTAKGVNGIIPYPKGAST